MRSGPLRFAANARKPARISMCPRDCWKVTALPGEVERMVQQASRLIDFSESPQDDSEPAGGHDSVIEHESWSKLVILLVVISCERLFKAPPPPNVTPLKQQVTPKTWPGRPGA